MPQMIAMTVPRAGARFQRVEREIPKSGPHVLSNSKPMPSSSGTAASQSLLTKRFRSSGSANDYGSSR